MFKVILETFFKILKRIKRRHDYFVFWDTLSCGRAAKLFKEKPDNLLCVDFVCRGVPSPGLWDNYVKYMENKYSSKIVGARFKHKTYGYHTSTMKIDFANGKPTMGLVESIHT